jgi:hypothetical protein
MLNVAPELAKSSQSTEQIESNDHLAKKNIEWIDLTLERLRSPERIPARLADRDHDVRVLWSCKELYPYLEKNLDQDNPVEYHSCCLVFTTKGSTKKKDHPQNKTMFVSKLFKKESITDVNSFNRFIEREVRKFPLHQQYHPGLNLKHDSELQREDDPIQLLT